MKIIKAHIAKKEKKQIEISTDFIRLDSFLKLCNVAETGGHAKFLIQDGTVKVNGEVTLSRGKKIRKGDNVEFNFVIYEVI